MEFSVVHWALCLSATELSVWFLRPDRHSDPESFVCDHISLARISFCLPRFEISLRCASGSVTVLILRLPL